MVPIFQTSTYAQSAPGVHSGHEYSRTSNPTRDALQTCLASLENAQVRPRVLFRDGRDLDAHDAVLERRSRRLERRRLRRNVPRLREGVPAVRAPLHVRRHAATRPRSSARSSRRRKLVWIESPTNPLLKITDIRAVAAIARERSVLLARRQHVHEPRAAAADRSRRRSRRAQHDEVRRGPQRRRRRIHRDESRRPLDPAQVLAERGRRRAGAVRLVAHAARHQDALRADARARNERARDRRSPLPPSRRARRSSTRAFPAHPGHEIQKKQASGFGGIISFRVRGGLERARAVCSATKLFFLAESLGGVESLIEHPAIMTHASVPEGRRARRSGITDDLIRLSVGIENEDDLSGGSAEGSRRGLRGARVERQDADRSGLRASRRLTDRLSPVSNAGPSG